MTIPLQDVQELALDDHEHAFYAPRGGDWLLLSLVVVVLLGNGVFAWHQLSTQGPDGEHAGHAIFFGLLLLCFYWSAILYTFKLSVGILVGPSGMSVVRGPWRTELAWREVARLVERMQVVDGQRLRWVVALARDGRRLQIREDMVDDYIRFRMEIYERYRMWRDHGGTWGTNASGPFTARETVSIRVVWWGVAAGFFVLPGLYFLILLPETGLFGPLLLLIGLICVMLSLRAFARRQTYIVDAKAIESRHIGRTIRLPWREVARVERSRHTFNAVIKASIVVGRFALKIATRSDKRLRSFEWYPRIPEYLTLRGAGHQIRVGLHRVARPDELLAWVEFYERIGRRAAASENLRKSTTVVSPFRESAPVQDFSAAGGPIDPWGTMQAAQDGATEAAGTPAMSAAGMAGDIAKNADWLWGDDADDEVDRSMFDDTADIPTRETLAVPHAANTPAEAFMAPGPQSTNGGTPTVDDEFEELPTAEMQAMRRPAHPTPAFGSDTRQPAVQGEDTRNDLLSQLWAPGEPRIAGKLPTPEQQVPQDTSVEVDQMPTNVGLFGFGVDESEAKEADPPTVETESLAESFAPWRTDASWQPPQLPRFGPPTQPKDAASQPEQTEQHDSGEFRADEFLR